MPKKNKILYTWLISLVFVPIIFFWIFTEIGGLSDDIAAKPAVLFGFISLGVGPERGVVLFLVTLFGTAIATVFIWFITWWLIGGTRSSRKGKSSSMREHHQEPVYEPVYDNAYIEDSVTDDEEPEE